MQGFAGVRAYGIDAERSKSLLEETLGFGPPERTYGRPAVTSAAATTPTTPLPRSRGFPGAGTVHHVAWAIDMDEIEAWQQRVAESGMRPTPVIDRFYFKSIYFREPNGILFELATLGPGFATDEDRRAPRRAALAAAGLRASARADRARLTPLPNPRG